MSEFSKLNGYDVKDSTARSKINKIVPLFIGDSYASGDVGGVENSWCTLVMSHFEKSFAIRSGGLGFSGKGTESLKWLTKLQDFVSNNDISEITDVFIVGGYNDHYTSVDVNRNYIKEFFTYAKNVFDSKVRFHVGFCGWCGLVSEVVQPTATQDSSVIREELINNVLIPYGDMSSECGYSFMGNLTGVLHNYSSCFAVDGYHPSSRGQRKIANVVMNYIISGSSKSNPERITLSFTTTDEQQSYLAQSILCENGVQLSAYNIGTFSITTPVTIPYQSAVEIGTLTSTPILGARNLRLLCKVRESTGVMHDALLVFTSNKLLMCTCDTAINANTSISICLESKFIAYEYC